MADYKDTVFLPKTDFPMRGSLAQKEPELLAFWQQIDLHGKLRAAKSPGGKFVLHDGPPYANGNIHIGHAVNKVLKDVINRCQQMLGKNAHYLPGWDCHGLPIEWKIEEQYREKKQNKDSVPVLQFRKECRDFAQHWLDVQKGEFKRLGVLGDWDHAYTTMTHAAEAGIAREIHKFAENGGLFRDYKPVMWSTVEKTALAEAEVEYADHTSTALFVKFPVVKTDEPKLKGASIVIWTTTPWTLPSNRAIAFGNFSYNIIETQKFGKLVVASNLLASFIKETGIEYNDWGLTDSKALAGTVTAHPLRGQGYDYDVPLHPGEFVTTDTGTGFVHIAPSHGEDDYKLGWQHKLEMPALVDGDGRFTEQTPLFAGKYIFNATGKKSGGANEAVIEALEKAGALLGKQSIVHSYPHSWRSKAPVIFRATPQWFISMEKNDLRKKALKAISDTKWFPAAGENRIRSMVETRPDWCISRQRAWGVPIAIFVAKQDGKILADKEVLNRTVEIFEKEGADAWFARSAADFLGAKHKPEDFEQIKDIVDVWFESGSTHAFVLEARKELGSPADLYLEGSDQHRGWFHSSLLESCGTRGVAPYKAVLTHGFVLDEQGRKMSKSAGNVVAPQEVTEKMGADILRLWIIGSDYTEDLRVGPEILKQYTEYYRRIRNTLRYLLGALAGFSDKEKINVAEMPELERWALHRLAELDKNIRANIGKHALNVIFTELHNFCAVDLSAFYFDIRKDSLYCDAPDSVKRRACRMVMNELFNCLTAWLAPILCFTAEEAWQARLKEGGVGEVSVHLRQLPDVPKQWADEALAEKWKRVQEVRQVVTGALERKRNEKVIGSSLQAKPIVYIVHDDAQILATVDFAEICITSDIKVEDFASFSSVSSKLEPGRPPTNAFTVSGIIDVGVIVETAPGEKCERCWRVLPEVGQQPAHKTLCKRCADAVSRKAEAA